MKIKSHGEKLAKVDTKTSKLALVLEKNIANLGKMHGDYLKKLALFKKMMEVMATKKVELRNAKAAKQASYKIVLKGKTQLSSQVNKHIDAKVKTHKALLSKIAGTYHTLSSQARAYNTKANSKLAGYQAGLLKVKYTHKNDYAKFKRQYSKTKGKHNKALGKWKRGIQRFMTTMFNKLKNTCTLKMDVNVKKSVSKKTHKKKIVVKKAAKKRRLQKLVAKAKKTKKATKGKKTKKATKGKKTKKHSSKKSHGKKHKSTVNVKSGKFVAPKDVVSIRKKIFSVMIKICNLQKKKSDLEEAGNSKKRIHLYTTLIIKYKHW